MHPENEWNELAHLIIQSVEDFWEVTLLSFGGSVLDMQRKVCDEFLVSRQTAKKMLKDLGVMYVGFRESAEIRKQSLEAIGFRCGLKHVGSTLLDAFNESVIIQKLCAVNGGVLDGLYLAKGGELMAYAIFSKSGQMISMAEFFDEDDEESAFRFYLASIRFLAKRHAFISDR